MRGAVQGVGFRPLVYGLASRLGLSGFVRNDAEGVLIEVEGAGADQFVHALRLAPPPLARIDSLDVAELPLARRVGLRHRRHRGGRVADPHRRRRRRVRGLPDRAVRPGEPLLSLSAGQLHPLRAALHADARAALRPRPDLDGAVRDVPRLRARLRRSVNRRFHAEPIACRACGPKLDAEIADVADCLRAGGIVALKGLGGYHLICDARDEAAVARLRRRKAREAKPFAVMATNAASAARVAEISRGGARAARIAPAADRAGAQPRRRSRRASRPASPKSG